MKPPNVIDMRFGPQDHACRGTWQYLGLNRGGHEVYYCEYGEHYGVRPHVAAKHVCSPHICSGIRVPEAQPADVPPGVSDADMQWLEAGTRDPETDALAYVCQDPTHQTCGCPKSRQR